MTRKHNERFRGRSEVTIFGRRAILEALASPGVEVRAIMLARGPHGAFEKQLRDAASSRGVPVDPGDPMEVSRRSAQPKHDQGVVARIDLRLVSDAETFAQELAQRPGTPARVLALDGVTNPQNVGMIVRSVVAAGLDGILWPLAGSPWVSGLLIKSSASALYQCRIITSPTIEEGLMRLRGAGCVVHALAARSDHSLLDHQPPARGVYVVGSETEGVSPQVAALADRTLAIPMAGGIDSLNVAVAASLVCFAAVRGASSPR